MGHLHYDGVAKFTFDDRLLTHLRSVIFAKLNLHESLVFTWSSEGKQRSIWLHPTMPLHFEFDGEETPDINPAWIELLRATANSPSGLRLIPEPAA